jgi:hypothetical protein
VRLVASVAAWLLCRLSGYTVAAWVAPLAIGTFCLGLFVGVENTTKGRFRVPLIAHRGTVPSMSSRAVTLNESEDNSKPCCRQHIRHKHCRRGFAASAVGRML